MTRVHDAGGVCGANTFERGVVCVCFAADFIKDDQDRWWMLQLKSFKLTPECEAHMAKLQAARQVVCSFLNTRVGCWRHPTYPVLQRTPPLRLQSMMMLQEMPLAARRASQQTLLLLAESSRTCSRMLVLAYICP